MKYSFTWRVWKLKNLKLFKIVQKSIWQNLEKPKKQWQLSEKNKLSEWKEWCHMDKNKQKRKCKLISILSPTSEKHKKSKQKMNGNMTLQEFKKRVF